MSGWRRGTWPAIALALGCRGDVPPSAERTAREAFVRALVEREGLRPTWLLASRGDVLLEEGLGPLEVDPPHRAMGRRVRLRVRGDGATDMRLAVRGRADVARLFHQPRLSVTVDGTEAHAALVEPDGRFTVETRVPRRAQHGWIDVYLVLSSVHDPMRTADVAQLEAIEWEPVGDGAAP